MTSKSDIKSDQANILPRPKRRPWWVWVIYAVIFLLLIALMAAYWVWSNRMGLLEKLAVDTLAEDGVEAELSLDELTKTHLTLSGVKLRFDGELFFASDSIRAEYQWRDLLEGRVERLTFKRPSATVTFDESWKISDGWVPPGLGSGGNGQSNLPPRGIIISEAEITMRTPYGTAELHSDANITDLKNLTADVTLLPAKLVRGAISAEASGQANFDISDGEITTQGRLNVPVLSHPTADAQNLTLNFNGSPDLTDKARRFVGDLGISFDSFDMAQAEFDDAEISWSGDIEQALIGFDLDGTWHANVAQVSLPDPARNENLAKTLSLSPALSATPIAQHFVPDLEARLFELFSRSSLVGAGTVNRDESGVVIALTSPVTAKSKKAVLTLNPASEKPVYEFDRAAQKITAAFDASLTRPAGLSAKDVRLTAKSFNGWKLDGIDNFSARIATSSTWQNNASPAALRPIRMITAYNGADSNHRRIKMSGAIDYDGPLPGGVVEGFQTAGDMGVHLRPNRLTIDFVPSAGVLTSTRVETTTDWTITQLNAQIGASKPLYDRIGDTAKTATTLSDLSFIATRRPDNAALNIRASQLKLGGRLATSQSNLTQAWEGDFLDSHITSDDIPGPDTDITLAQGAFTADLSNNTPLTFSMKAPAANVKSPLIQAKDIGLDVAGTPNAYQLNHEGGLVKLTANDLPPMPLKGSVTFEDGAFIGETVAYLPQANNTPINISYRIKDSAGTAVVDIPEIRFTPNGFQPQTLIPALRGKIARAEGTTSAKINLAFAAGQPMRSSGTATLNNMNFGTAPGPASGVSTTVDLESVLPLKTRGRQILTLDQFDPGLPLVNGVIEYELIPEGIKIYSARWPLGDGFFSLDPFTWLYTAKENRMTLRLEKVGLGEFINNLGNGALKATGDLEGSFPIVISGINVLVENGLISVPNGGRIQYAAAEADATTEVNRFAGAAMEALKDFRYQELFAKVNGPLDGEVIVGLKFEGKNQEVLSGQPFEFDVTVEGELFNILRSFNSNEHIKSSVARKTGTVPVE